MDALDQAPRTSGGPSARSARLAAAAKAGAAAAVLGTLDLICAPSCRTSPPSSSVAPPRRRPRCPSSGGDRAPDGARQWGDPVGLTDPA